MPIAFTLRAAAVAAVALMFTGCSDDDGVTSEAAPGVDAPDEGAAAGDCAGTDLSFTDRTTGESGSATSAFASTVLEDTLYNVYATDFDLGPDDLGGFTPEVDPGQHAVMIAINAFGAGDGDELEPLAVGEEIAWTSTGDGTTKALLVTLVTSDEVYNQASSPDAGGTLTVTAVGDVVCGEVAYEDADKEVSGTFEAPVTDRAPR